MLKLHTPIQLKNDPSLLTLRDDFAERMRANYMQIGSALAPEDLLHLISAPPEIYLAETGAHSLVDLTNSFSTQEIRLNLINNVLNRVLLSETCGLTYQDQVFVENTLHKLGVTDVKEFMHQVRLLREETNNRNELTDLYWENREELTALLLEARKMRGQRTSPETDEEQRQDIKFWLHQEIFDRLCTGVIYQELRNYLSQRIGDVHFLTRQELQASEQSVAAEHILLNRLKSSTVRKQLPLVYNRVNLYEIGGTDETGVKAEGKSEVLREIASAVLLNAVDEIYAISFEELHRKKNVWYELANAVYETAQNTFARFESFHAYRQTARTGIEEYRTQVRESQSREITILKELLTRYTAAQTVSVPQQTRAGAELVYGEPGEDMAEADVTHIYQDARTANENYIRQQREREELTKLIHADELLHRESRTHTKQREQQYERLRETERIRTETMRIDREKAQDDLWRVMEEPQEVLMEYLSARTQAEEDMLEERRRLRGIYGEDTVRIFETLAMYRTQPEVLLEQGIVGRDAPGQFERDIRMEHLSQERTQEEFAESHASEVRREIAYIRTQAEHSREKEVGGRRETERKIQSAWLLHREQETVLDETFLEELRTASRSSARETTETQQLANERNVMEQTVTNRVNELHLNENEELEEILGRKVRQQLRGVSEQVYRKLEKRMDAERRRRGL